MIITSCTAFAQVNGGLALELGAALEGDGVRTLAEVEFRQLLCSQLPCLPKVTESFFCRPVIVLLLKFQELF